MKKNQWKFVSETDYLNNNIRDIEHPKVVKGIMARDINHLLDALNTVQYQVHYFSLPIFTDAPGGDYENRVAIITDPKVEKLLYQLHKAVFEAVQKYDAHNQDD